jgi:hypothetical protein
MAALSDMVVICDNYVSLRATINRSNGFDRTDADLDEIVRRISAAPLSYDRAPGGGTPWRSMCSVR